jgi:hypothetical protein
MGACACPSPEWSVGHSPHGKISPKCARADCWKVCAVSAPREAAVSVCSKAASTNSAALIRARALTGSEKRSLLTIPISWSRRRNLSQSSDAKYRMRFHLERFDTAGTRAGGDILTCGNRQGIQDHISTRTMRMILRKKASQTRVSSPSILA